MMHQGIDSSVVVQTVPLLAYDDRDLERYVQRRLIGQDRIGQLELQDRATGGGRDEGVRGYDSHRRRSHTPLQAVNAPEDLALGAEEQHVDRVERGVVPYTQHE